jgi:4-oxalocrotonate tautomerase
MLAALESADAMVSIEERTCGAPRGSSSKEVHSGEWGIGGKPLSTEDVQALAAGTPACLAR